MLAYLHISVEKRYFLSDLSTKGGKIVPSENKQGLSQ